MYKYIHAFKCKHYCIKIIRYSSKIMINHLYYKSICIFVCLLTYYSYYKSMYFWFKFFEIQYSFYICSHLFQKSFHLYLLIILFSTLMIFAFDVNFI